MSHCLQQLEWHLQEGVDNLTQREEEQDKEQEQTRRMIKCEQSQNLHFVELVGQRRAEKISQLTEHLKINWE